MTKEKRVYHIPQKGTAPSTTDPDNSVSLYDKNRLNEQGTTYCVAPDITEADVDFHWYWYLKTLREEYGGCSLEKLATIYTKLRKVERELDEQIAAHEQMPEISDLDHCEYTEIIHANSCIENAEAAYYGMFSQHDERTMEDENSPHTLDWPELCS